MTWKSCPIPRLTGNLSMSCTEICTLWDSASKACLIEIILRGLATTAKKGVRDHE